MRETIAQQFADEMVRIEHCIFIAGINALDGALPDVFEEEFCEWLSEREDAPIYAALPKLARFCKVVDPDPQEVAELIYDAPGFLIQVATPVVDPIGRGFSYSWGHYQTEWLYASSEAAIAKVAIEWAQAQHEKRREAATA